MRIFHNRIVQIVSVIFIMLLIYLVSRQASPEVNNYITIATAIGGFAIIIVQLRQDHKIKKAEFIYDLNAQFSEDEDIAYIYMKLKQYRDSSGTLKFTGEDGRRMGSYVMFFMIMEYLLQEHLITIDMIDAIFANKFFLFCDNPYTYQYQLRQKQINYPILSLYAKWYNYRCKKNLLPIVTGYSISDKQSLFQKDENNYITLKPIQ